MNCQTCNQPIHHAFSAGWVHNDWTIVTHPATPSTEPATSRPFVRGAGRVSSALVVLAMLLAFPLGAMAATVTFTFTAAGFVTPGNVSAGDVLTLATFDMAGEGYGDLIGETCTFSARSQNGESVHVNSYAEILTNGNATDILGTEDGVNGVHVVDRTLEVGPTIAVFYHVGARALGELPIGVSVNLTIGVTCQTEDTTTSTTVSYSTSTTAPQTTTVPDSSTSSTVPPITPPPTVPPATSTTAPTGSTTTTNPTACCTPERPPTTTVPPVTSPPTLPYTGVSGVAGLGMAAAALIALGGFGVVSARPKGRHSV
jgi:hypothetical protein